MAKRDSSPQDANQPRGRRARREANDSLLEAGGGGGALGPADLADLFSYRTPSFWGSWQAFAALPEAARAAAAAAADAPRPRGGGAGRRRPAGRGDGGGGGGGGGGGSDAALRRAEQALARVEPGVRELLVQGFNERLVRSIESDVRGLRGQGEVCFVLESARDRAVAHGVSRYYGLKSRSFDTAPPKCQRVTVIRADAASGRRLRPQVQLADLVLPRQQGAVA